MEQAVEYLDTMPLAGWCTLSEEDKQYLYLHVEKTWYHDSRVMPKRQVESQKRKRLLKKRELKEAKEASDTSKRAQYAIFESMPVYRSMKDLEDELKSMFPAAKDVPPLSEI